METRPALIVALLAALAAVATPAAASIIADRDSLPVGMIGCEPLKVPARAKLVVVGVYDGEALSSAYIGGPDEETNVTDVIIEPGQQPLVLVLTSHESMVWRLSGATRRVVQVQVSSFAAEAQKRHKVGTAAPGAGKSGRQARDNLGSTGDGAYVSEQWSYAGVTGIARDKVTIRHAVCPGYFTKSSGPEFTAAREKIAETLGRAPDAMFGTYSPRQISLPSGKVTRARPETTVMPRGFDPTVWREAARYWPGGLVSVDPASVVAKARVAPYRVLPSQMGLAQLVGAGAVQRLTESKFRVVKPIAHMPPSMGGAHSVKLILAKGVPMPPGDPVHSCIVYEDGSRPPSDAFVCSLPKY